MKKYEILHGSQRVNDFHRFKETSSCKLVWKKSLRSLLLSRFTVLTCAQILNSEIAF